MRSTFFGIEVARRALFAQQRAMDVASHNIANANDPAYSRQRAEMEATAPYAPPGTAPAGVAGQVGTGVWVKAIQRLRDEYLDARIRGQGQLSAYWQVQRDTFEQIEKIFNEPSDQGIRVALDQFWQALQDLSVTPDSMAVRETVVQRGKLLADAIGTVFRQLEALRADLDTSLGLKVDRLNTLAQDLARLNKQIAQVQASGQRPNDLLDRRDAILEEMARLAAVNVTFRTTAGGAQQVAVSIGGLALVDGENAHRLVMSGIGPEREVHWESTSGPKVSFTGGEIGAILDLRGTIGAGPGSATGAVPELMKALDDWTQALAGEFNAAHGKGYDLSGQQGGPFFSLVDSDGDGWVADSLSVESAIMANPALIAAAGSSSAGAGDGSGALALAAVLKSQPLTGIGNVTLPDYFASLVGRIGVQTQQAQTMADNQQLVLDQLEGLRQSISGVSLDEEMADLIRFEHAYGAAARAMTAMDEVLDTLINRTGLVGR